MERLDRRTEEWMPGWVDGWMDIVKEKIISFFVFPDQ